MAELQQQLIWLGAGSASQPALNFSAYQQVVLMDAREEATQALIKQFAALNAANVVVRTALIHSQSGSYNLQRYNLPEFAAITPVTGLKALFPGLKATSSETVQAQSLPQLLTELALTGDQNTLVLDIADLAYELVQALIQHKQLALFNTIIVQYGATELYSGMPAWQQLAELLRKHYYCLQHTDNNDPDLPRYTLGLDAAAKKQAQLTSKVKQLAEQLAAAEAQLSANQQQSQQRLNELKTQQLNEQQLLEQQKAELTKQLAAAQQQAATEKQQLEQQKAELTKQLAAAQQQAATEKQQLEQQKAELTKQLEAAKEQAEQAKSAKAELAKQLEASQQQLAVQKQQVEQVSAAKGELAKQLEASQQQLAAQKQQAEQATNAKVELAKQLDVTQQQLAAQKQQTEQANAAKTELAKQLEASQQQLAAKKQQAEQADSVKAEAAKQLEASQQQILGLVEEKFQKLMNEQTTKLVTEVQNAKNSLSWVIGNSAKQVESFIGIQNYLEKGIKPLSFHGWPISPDIGLYITGLIDSNNYDVIIEFGSGTSTVLMAKTLQAKQRGVEQKNITDKQRKVGSSQPLEFEDYTDLPSRIISFEHNSKYHAQTLEALKNNGVDHLVNLVHAPLVEYQYRDGTEYLYYSCTETLQDIAKIFKGRNANFLVLVDGPPGSTNKNARFPCLPHLLKTLPNHSYTIVMDDYGRAEEKETTELWRKILEERSYSVSIETVANEKGLAILRVE